MIKQRVTLTTISFSFWFLPLALLAAANESLCCLNSMLVTSYVTSFKLQSQATITNQSHPSSSSASGCCCWPSLFSHTHEPSVPQVIDTPSAAIPGSAILLQSFHHCDCCPSKLQLLLLTASAICNMGSLKRRGCMSIARASGDMVLMLNNLLEPQMVSGGERMGVGWRELGCLEERARVGMIGYGYSEPIFSRYHEEFCASDNKARTDCMLAPLSPSNP
nr:hypothetical protein Iba_chr12dCG15020 [Ipomoea batatas]